MKNEQPITVYAIRNKKTGRIYIGSTVDPKSRVASHFNELKNKRKNTRLPYPEPHIVPSQWQRDYDAYGFDSFEWYILEENIPYEKRAQREEYYIKLYRAAEKEYGYNAREVVGECYDRAFNPGKPPVPIPAKEAV